MEKLDFKRGYYGELDKFFNKFDGKELLFGKEKMKYITYFVRYI